MTSVCPGKKNSWHGPQEDQSKRHPSVQVRQAINLVHRGIRVNAICPGRTSSWSDLWEDQRRRHLSRLSRLLGWSKIFFKRVISICPGRTQWATSWLCQLALLKPHYYRIVKLVTKTDDAGTVETPSWEERVQVRLDFWLWFYDIFDIRTTKLTQQWNAEEI